LFARTLAVELGERIADTEDRDSFLDESRREP
jgi:hypothetical protein